MPRKESTPATLRNKTRIKQALNTLANEYGSRHLYSDPVRFAHAYQDPPDQEVAGFLAAVFAYGQVSQILANLQRIFSAFPDRIFLPLLDPPAAGWHARYRDFAYRFQDREDLVQILTVLRRVLQKHGSLEAAFLPHYLLAEDHPHPIRQALVGWVGSFRSALPDPRAAGQGHRRGLLHLLSDPASGSPCKRWNLYLRWMARGPDGTDLGLWRSVSPRLLVLPLDTHTARISRYLRFTRRTTPTWRMAEEITSALRALDPDDPVRYDFAMARLGILNLCGKRKGDCRCGECALHVVCHREDRPIRRNRAYGGPGRRRGFSNG